MDRKDEAQMDKAMSKLISDAAEASERFGDDELERFAAELTKKRTAHRQKGARFLKRAWIRRQDVPAGQPATGTFSCECGRTVAAGYYGQGADVSCECGLTYNNTGWIRGRGGEGDK